MMIELDCPVCGTLLQPERVHGCATCPLHAGCRFVCCPQCGHRSLDPQGSRLARWVGATWEWLQGGTATSLIAEPQALTAAPRGPVQVVAIAECARPTLARLRAYGIVVGAQFELLQQQPVTVVRIEHVELAIENELAAVVQVVWGGHNREQAWPGA